MQSPTSAKNKYFRKPQTQGGPSTQPPTGPIMWKPPAPGGGGITATIGQDGKPIVGHQPLPTPAPPGPGRVPRSRDSVGRTGNFMGGGLGGRTPAPDSGRQGTPQPMLLSDVGKPDISQWGLGEQRLYGPGGFEPGGKSLQVGNDFMARISQNPAYAEQLQKSMGAGQPGGIGGISVGRYDMRDRGAEQNPGMPGFGDQGNQGGAMPPQQAPPQGREDNMPAWKRARLRRNPGGGGQLGNPNNRMQLGGMDPALVGGVQGNGVNPNIQDAQNWLQEHGGMDGLQQWAQSQGSPWSQGQFNPQTILAQMQGQYGNFGGGPQYQL